MYTHTLNIKLPDKDGRFVEDVPGSVVVDVTSVDSIFCLFVSERVTLHGGSPLLFFPFGDILLGARTGD